MDRWRLTQRGERVLANWSEGAATEHRQKMADVLETIADGTWKQRWWNQPAPQVEGATEIRAGCGLIVTASRHTDRDHVWIDLRYVWVVEDDEADLGSPRD